MEINIDNYLSEYDKKEIAISEYRNAIRSQISSEADLQRILSNAGFHSVYKIVDECFDVDSKKIIKEKIDQILKNTSYYHLFQKPDVWSRETNTAYQYLQDCINENRPAIKSKVEELLDAQTIESCKQDIKELVHEYVLERIQSL